MRIFHFDILIALEFHDLKTIIQRELKKVFPELGDADVESLVEAAKPFIMADEKHKAEVSRIGDVNKIFVNWCHIPMDSGRRKRGPNEPMLRSTCDCGSCKVFTQRQISVSDSFKEILREMDCIYTLPPDWKSKGYTRVWYDLSEVTFEFTPELTESLNATAYDPLVFDGFGRPDQISNKDWEEVKVSLYSFIRRYSL